MRYERVVWVLGLVLFGMLGLCLGLAEGSSALPALSGEATASPRVLTSSQPARFYTTTVIIPTYPYTEYLEMALNPTYNITYPVLDWASYESSAPTPVSVTYELLVMENDYLTVTLLPELGGRVYQIIDKATGENHLYQNPVIKPTRWGPPEQGWWLAVGGIEWCLPVEEHGYEWGVPWAWQALTSTRGVTVTVRDSNAPDRLRAEISLFLPADRAALDMTPRLENPTAVAIDYKFWLNAALALGAENLPSAETEFIFNAARVAIHSTGDSRLPGAGDPPTAPDHVISWPIYQGVDYSRLGNWREWIGFFEFPQAMDDFVGLYDHARHVGMARVFPREIARGTKGFGYGWESAIDWHYWTDEKSGGVEIHGGVAPTFWDMATLAAGESISWTESWYPVRDMGGLSHASAEAALHAAVLTETLFIDVRSTVSRAEGATRLLLWDRTTCLSLTQWTLPAHGPTATLHLSRALGLSQVRMAVSDTLPITRSLDELAIAYVDAEGNVLASVNDAGCLNPPERPAPHLGYGINVRQSELISSLVTPLGFEWVKLWEEYGVAPPTATLAVTQNVLYLIHCDGPDLDDMVAWDAHVARVARAGRGNIQAYEICNEPNVARFWNGRPPDPALYTQMLCRAYTQIKHVDPGAIVVSGGLAPVGRILGTHGEWVGHNGAAMDEQSYLQGMIDHGALMCMDAFGYHPYGYAYAPEHDPVHVPNGFAFRGVEQMRDILVAAGGAHLPIWATEFNWLRDPEEDGRQCDGDPNYFEYFNWQEVTEATQADYLLRAFEYADLHWPWMEAMFVWNVDWHDYRPSLPCEASRYYSIRRANGATIGEPTLAYTALQQMPKRPANLMTPKLKVTPLERVLKGDTLMLGSLMMHQWHTSVLVDNVGRGVLTWTATISPNGVLTPTLPVTRGRQGEELWIHVDLSGLELGVYTSTIVVTAEPTITLDSPQTVTLEVHVLEKLHRVYLPAIQRQFNASQSITGPRGPSKIGIHALSNGGTTDLVQGVSDGGAHVAVVKGVASLGFLERVKDISPETITIGRWPDILWEAIHVGGDPALEAERYMNRHMQEWEPNRAYVDYWEILNEVDPLTVDGHVWLAEFFSETMQIAEDNGYKLALFSYSMGVPEWYEWKAIVETGVFARAKAGGHILSLHEYANPVDAMWGDPLPQYPGQPYEEWLRHPNRGALTGRYRHLYEDFLIPRDEVIPLVITEFNVAIDDPAERGEVFVDSVAWYDDILREDDYVLGMNIFTLGGMGWEHFDFREYLPDLQERIIALKDG